MTRPEIAVGAIAVRDGCLLMVRRGHGPAGGRWSLPGGRIEWGELAAEALVREVAEETALTVVCGPLVGWTEILEDDHHFVVLDFEAIVMEGDEPVAGDDAAEAAWIPLPEVTELRLTDGLADILADHDVIELL
ncbi:MAG TPA: NUDIX domain-containing protein [Microthrixaceae bacterium]|nr:NUDIX domain-containing protein [Microthrixaceae bacterium]